jgi:hypothetical protein
MCGGLVEDTQRPGEIQLEPKDVMKRRGLPSSDLADAFATTFAAEVATLPAQAD